MILYSIKEIFQTYKYLEDTLSEAEQTFPLSVYRPPKPYTEVNDSYMTVLGSQQDPVYVPTVLEVSGSSTPFMYSFPFLVRKDGPIDAVHDWSPARFGDNC